MIGPIVNPLWQEWTATALAEGRLSWRVTDAQGRPCNGGDAEPIPLGEWSPTIEDAALCRRGWHTTSDPVRWRGSRVWLVEGDGLVGEDGDKRAWQRIRPLAEVDPRRSICRRIQVASTRPNLHGADLRGADLRGAYLAEANLTEANLSGTYLHGANLRGADLTGANLTGASLAKANLHGADLRGADLRRADLRWAYLAEADLHGANLRGAYLAGAYLAGANLRGADLTGANLRGAYLDRADLRGAYLARAYLRGAYLAGWERGPDGYARRVAP